MTHNEIMQKRLAEYARMRDNGATSRQAIAELGLSEHTQVRYERWYRETHLKLEPRQKSQRYITDRYTHWD